MARGPGGERRPDDPAAAAVAALRIATGEAVDTLEAPHPPKDPAAVSLGRSGGIKGGVARALSLSPERRAEIARIAAKARHAKE